MLISKKMLCVAQMNQTCSSESVMAVLDSLEEVYWLALTHMVRLCSFRWDKCTPLIVRNKNQCANNHANVHEI